MAISLPRPLPDPVTKTISFFTDLRGKNPTGKNAFIEFTTM